MEHTTPGYGIHHGLVFGSGTELVAGVLPFLRSAADADEPVLAVVSADTREVLDSALGADAAVVDWADAGRWFTFPAHALRRAAAFAADGGTRLLGEAVWGDRSPLELREWVRYESLLNLALPEVTVLCAYDARVSAPAVVDAAAFTHPVLTSPMSESELRGRFVATDRFSALCDAEPLSEPPASAETMAFGAHDVFALRRWARETAAACGLWEKRVEEVVLAVNEAATNAVEHGGGVGTVCAWAEELRLVIEVRNAAGRIPHLLTGYLPPDPGGVRGRGLWLMRRLVDLVEIRHRNPGVTVRLHVWLIP